MTMPQRDSVRLPLRLLLVDDNQLWLTLVRRFCAADTRVAIVGEAHSGEAALEHVAQLQPDLVLMDLAMGEMNGLETTQQIKAKPDAPWVVIVTLQDTPAHRAAATAVGADGFLAKATFSTAWPALITALVGEELQR